MSRTYTLETQKMAYDFYWISGSTNVWRAMLTLEYKGIAYNSHRLDSSQKDQKKPEFLALNPRGQVPVLKSGDTIIHESVAIMAFLERAQPEPALFGRTAAETGLVWQRIMEVVNYTRDPVEQGIVFPLFRGEAGTHPDRLKEASITALESIKWIETILEHQDYLAGNEPTAADINAMPIIQMLRRVGMRPDAMSLGLGLDDLASSHPAISAWLQRLEKLPGYEAAYPPHWRT